MTRRRALLLAATMVAGSPGCGAILGVDDYGTRGDGGAHHGGSGGSGTGTGGSGGSGGSATGGSGGGSGGSGPVGACVAEAAPSFAAPAALTVREGAGYGERVATSGAQVFLAGRIDATTGLSFGNGPLLTSPDGDGVYLASLDSGAADPHRWSLALRPIGSGSAAVYGQALAREGRTGPVTAIALAGDFTGTVGFASGGVAPQSTQGGANDLDAFVALVDPDGTPRWLRGFGDGTEQRALGVTIDGDGHVVIAVHGDGAFDFGPGCPADAGAGMRLFLAAFDPADGSCAWSTSFPTGPLQQPVHLKPIDLAYSPADDTLVLTGATRGSGWFGPSDGADRIFVLRVGPDHVPRTPTLIGGESPGYGERWAETVAVDDCGNAFIGGGFRNDLVIDGEVRRTSPTHQDDDAEADAVVCKITPDGAVAWCHVFAAGGAQLITGVAVSGAGLVAVSGRLEQSGAIAGDGTVITPDPTSMDAFVAALLDHGDGSALTFGRAFGDDDGNEQRANGVAVDASGRITTTGNFYSALRHAEPPGGQLLAAGYAPFVLSFSPAP